MTAWDETPADPRQAAMAEHYADCEWWRGVEVAAALGPLDGD